MKRSIILAALLAAPPVEADQTRCAPVMTVIQKLAGKYGEHPVMLGDLHDARGQIIVFANPDTGTWTVVQFRQGTACVMAAGDAAQLPELPAQGEPT